MEKIYGTDKSQNGLVKVGQHKYVLFYGYYEAENGSNGYEYRETFNHKPTIEEVKAILFAQINSNCQERITSGMEYNGKKIWLSSENQRNYSDWYMLRSTLEYPVRIRVGESGNEEYMEFGTSNALTSFYKATVEHIRQCVHDCWEEKDSIDWTQFATID